MKTSRKKRLKHLRGSLSTLCLLLLGGIFNPGANNPWAASSSGSLVIGGTIPSSTSVHITALQDFEAIDLQTGATAIEVARVVMRMNNNESLSFAVKSNNGNVLMNQGGSGPSYTMNIEEGRQSKRRSPSSSEAIMVLRMNLAPLQPGPYIPRGPYSDTIVFSVSAH